MSLFVCSKCGCIDNTATSCYWALVRPCKNRVYDESLKGYETMQDIYSDNYRLKVYTGNCIIQLNANPKDPSESFFDVYDRDEMKLIYSIKNSILKEMFII